MMTDPAGVGDRLRELGAEVAMLATGRDAGLWLYALEALARQADELEQQRDQWRAANKRVRAEAASWAWTVDVHSRAVADIVNRAEECRTSPQLFGDTDDMAVSVTAAAMAAATISWCADRVRGALDG